MKLTELKIIWTVILALFLTSAEAMAQKDSKAREILEAMTAAYNKADGLEITFGGTVEGKIKLKGRMFMLDCDGVKTWFDGVTQWSYLVENNEVNISSPTEEEQNMVNPYALIRMYEKGYNYKYMGSRNIDGEKCEMVMLIPEVQQDYQSITVGINQRMEPINIEFVYSEEEKETISVKEYKHNRNLTENDFRFDMDAHSDAEIIDLR